VEFNKNYYITKNGGVKNNLYVDSVFLWYINYAFRNKSVAGIL